MVGSGRKALHHFMVEVGSLDDVGQGYDLAQIDESRIAFTLGRRTNDDMTSFCVNTPSGFFIEYGRGRPRDRSGELAPGKPETQHYRFRVRVPSLVRGNTPQPTWPVDARRAEREQISDGPESKGLRNFSTLRRRSRRETPATKSQRIG
jgi:hypothetical protein